MSDGNLMQHGATGSFDMRSSEEIEIAKLKSDLARANFKADVATLVYDFDDLVQYIDSYESDIGEDVRDFRKTLESVRTFILNRLEATE